MKRSGSSARVDEIAGVRLTHPDRVLYPEQGITKRDLARYYEEIADWILPHLEDRPLTLLRCPQGHKKYCFVQRHAKESVHPSIHPMTIEENGASAPYLYIDSLTGLIALVQMGVLELHTWGARRQHIERPDRLIFDLDPDAAISWQALVAAAQALRQRLGALGLTAFVKSTGGKGLHVVTPIAPKQDWDFAKEFSKTVVERMVRESPARYIATMSKARRKGKIFIDYLRNARAASAISTYSTRARAGATVSVPLAWDELGKDIRGEFTIRNVPQRLRKVRDPWGDYDSARVAITRAMLKKL